ncbi:MAG: CBS domain-containing protein [Candidatus Aenigmatarchaeota archaeon]
MFEKLFSLFKRKKIKKRKRLKRRRKQHIILKKSFKTQKKRLLVSEVMTKKIIPLYANQTLYEAAKLFIEKNISGAPVLDKNYFTGELSKTDILKLVEKKDLLELNEKDYEILKKHKVFDFMKKPICINENETIDNARRKMEKYKIKRLLVIDKKKRLVGIITLTDLIRGVSKEEIKERIYTKIDDMLKLLEKKEMSIKEISKQLSIDENLVEEWAKILEEKGLVEINYRPFSSPILKIKSKIK